MRIKIVAIHGESLSASPLVPLKESGTSIGCSTNNDLVISSEGATSERHAVIEKTQDQWIVVDHGDLVPIRLNNRALGFGEKAGLKSGDVLRIGATSLEISDESEADILAYDSGNVSVFAQTTNPEESLAHNSHIAKASGSVSLEDLLKPPVIPVDSTTTQHELSVSLQSNLASHQAATPSANQQAIQKSNIVLAEVQFNDLDPLNPQQHSSQRDPLLSIRSSYSKMIDNQSGQTLQNHSDAGQLDRLFNLAPRNSPTLTRARLQSTSFITDLDDSISQPITNSVAHPQTGLMLDSTITSQSISAHVPAVDVKKSLDDPLTLLGQEKSTIWPKDDPLEILSAARDVHSSQQRAKGQATSTTTLQEAAVDALFGITTTLATK